MKTITRPITDFDRLDQAEKLRGTEVQYSQEDEKLRRFCIEKVAPALVAIEFERMTGKPFRK